MILRIGGVSRPINEATVVPSYSYVFDRSRRILAVLERWDIRGKVILQSEASQARMTSELLKLSSALGQTNPDLMQLDDNGAETPMVLRANRCSRGPYIVDASLPIEDHSVYATGVPYRVVFEAERPLADGVTKFQETLQSDPGGPTFVYVGGSLNYPERQVGKQSATYRYVQSGSAVGYLARPPIPGPIWPFALTRRDWPKVGLSSPENVGIVDTGFAVTWHYEYEWHMPLYGKPHRS